MIVLRFVFITLCCITNAITGNAQKADSLQQQLSRKWNNAKAYAIRLAEQMPDDAFSFKPVPEVMSFREQLLHTADNMYWLTSTFLFAEKASVKPDTAAADKAAVLNYLSDAYDRGWKAHFSVSSDQLDEIVPFFAGPMTRRQILLLMHDHQTHHIGQLILYLRLKGIKPVPYVGW